MSSSRRGARGAGGGWTCRCTDTRTWECSLNVSVTSRCHDARCRDVVPTFESAGQQKKKKIKEERNCEEKERKVDGTGEEEGRITEGREH